MFKRTKFTKFKTGGFTLIELMAVVAIIGILIGIIAITYSSSKSKARDAQRKSDLKQMQTVIETYMARKGKYPLGEKTSWYDQNEVSYHIFTGTSIGGDFSSDASLGEIKNFKDPLSGQDLALENIQDRVFAAEDKPKLYYWYTTPFKQDPSSTGYEYNQKCYNLFSGLENPLKTEGTMVGLSEVFTPKTCQKGSATEVIGDFSDLYITSNQKPTDPIKAYAMVAAPTVYFPPDHINNFYNTPRN